MGALLLLALLLVARGEIVIDVRASFFFCFFSLSTASSWCLHSFSHSQAPHPWAGTYPLSVFRAFGWQSFKNASFELVTLTTPQASIGLCVGGLPNVTGKVVGFVFPIVTTAQPGLGECGSVLFFSLCASVRTERIALSN